MEGVWERRCKPFSACGTNEMSLACRRNCSIKALEKDRAIWIAQSKTSLETSSDNLQVGTEDWSREKGFLRLTQPSSTWLSRFGSIKPSLIEAIQSELAWSFNSMRYQTARLVLMVKDMVMDSLEISERAVMCNEELNWRELWNCLTAESSCRVKRNTTNCAYAAFLSCWCRGSLASLVLNKPAPHVRYFVMKGGAL